MNGNDHVERRVVIDMTPVLAAEVRTIFAYYNGDERLELLNDLFFKYAFWMPRPFTPPCPPEPVKAPSRSRRKKA